MEKKVLNGVEFYRKAACDLLKENNDRLVIHGNPRSPKNEALVCDSFGISKFIARDIDTDELLNLILQKYVLDDDDVESSGEVFEELYVSKLDREVKNNNVLLIISYDYNEDNLKAQLAIIDDRLYEFHGNSITELLDKIEDTL